MDRRELAALFVGCEPGDLLGYNDYGDHVAVVLPDGRKMAIRSSELDAMKVVAAAPARVKVSPEAPAKKAVRTGSSLSAKGGKPAPSKTVKKSNAPISEKTKKGA